MTTLASIAADPQQRTKLVHDITALIERQVQAVSGLSGMAIRTGYKVVASLKGGRMIPGAVNVLLDDFCAALEPFVAEAQAKDAPLTSAWSGRERAVSEALLAITDNKAKNASALLQRPYRKLRSFGEAQVTAAVPELARTLERYV